MAITQATLDKTLNLLTFRSFPSCENEKQRQKEGKEKVREVGVTSLLPRHQVVAEPRWQNAQDRYTDRYTNTGYCMKDLNT